MNSPHNNEKLIANFHKTRHDVLSKAFYDKKRLVGITPQEQKNFDTEHAKIWNDLHAELVSKGLKTEKIERI